MTGWRSSSPRCRPPRALTDPAPVERGLAWALNHTYGGTLTVRVGTCPPEDGPGVAGADRLVRDWVLRRQAEGASVQPEWFPVTDEERRMHGPRAAPLVRNLRMVGHQPWADMCLAWLSPCGRPACRRSTGRHASHGTTNTLGHAVGFGLEIHAWRVS